MASKLSQFEHTFPYLIDIFSNHLIESKIGDADSQLEIGNESLEYDALKAYVRYIYICLFIESNYATCILLSISTKFSKYLIISSLRYLFIAGHSKNS